MSDIHREGFSRKECSAYVASSHSCANGFPFLTGICFGCDGTAPMCVRDDVPAHLMQDDGHPFYWSALRYRDEQEKQA